MAGTGHVARVASLGGGVVRGSLLRGVRDRAAVPPGARITTPAGPAVASAIMAMAAMRRMSVGDRIGALVADLDGVAELRCVGPAEQGQRAVLAEEHLDRDPLAGARPKSATTNARGTAAVVVDVAH